MFSTILLAYDGSKASHKAFDHAIQLARLTPDSLLKVLHVYSYPRIYIGEAIAPVPASVNKEYYDIAVETSDKAREMLEEAGVQGTVEMVLGSPAETILQYAESNSADLIIIGSRGLGGIREFVLGSVSHNVVQHARIPVLVVK